MVQCTYTYFIKDDFSEIWTQFNVSRFITRPLEQNDSMYVKYLGSFCIKYQWYPCIQHNALYERAIIILYTKFSENVSAQITEKFILMTIHRNNYYLVYSIYNTVIKNNNYTRGK